MDMNMNPWTNVRDFTEFMGFMKQIESVDELAKIRALLERDSKKGVDRARALEALLSKHTCPNCVRGKGIQRTTTSCGRCSGKKGELLETEIPYKERMNLEPLKQPCKSCGGSGGNFNNTAACPQCEGTGEKIVYGRTRQSDGRVLREDRLPAITGKGPVYICPSCKGTGSVTNHCVMCKDTGIVKREEYEKELKRIENTYR